MKICKKCEKEYQMGYVGLGTGYREFYCSKECAKQDNYKGKIW